MTDSLGSKIRRQRRRLGLTLDDLAAKTAISKPYLSLIETGRVPNPPSDEKLRRLEQTLGFAANELLAQAHLARTPRDVRAMLQKLLAEKGAGRAGKGAEGAEGAEGADDAPGKTNGAGANGGNAAGAPAAGLKPGLGGGINLDDAYLSGVLQQLVDQSAGNVERVVTKTVPVINKVSAGYPRDFTDLSYPPRVADDYVGCPEIDDKDAFAARVHGDSMTPKYREGDIVIFSPGAVPKSGDDCFVRFADGHTTFKRVFFENDESNEPAVRLQPRNERYRPQVAKIEDVAGVYKAIYRYQRVDQD